MQKHYKKNGVNLQINLNNHSIEPPASRWFRGVVVAPNGVGMLTVG